MSAENGYGLSGTQAWPTMFFTRRWEQHAVHGAPVVALLQRLRTEQTTEIASGIAPGSKSAKGLYESDFELFAKPDPHLQMLVKFIETTLALAVCMANNQEAQPQHINIEFVDSWYHITNQGGFHDAHVHHGCSWCGIYYLQTGTSGSPSRQGAPNGGSRFYSPFNPGGGYRDFGNKYLTASLDAPIDDGLLLLFPSYLMHSGLPYQGDVDRVVIAFNARAFLTDQR